MKLIWHIIRKDIRSERWTLLFWMALYAAQTGLGLVAFHHDDGERDFVDGVWLGNLILVAMQFVTAYVLVVRLVQADAIVGTRMFWLTRPIAPGRLLRAKGWGVLLLFGLLPVLLRAPWWLYCGFTANDLGWAAVETLGWQLLLIAPAFLIASLTDDFGRAVMWGLLLIVFLVGGGIFLNSWRIGLGGALWHYNGLLFTRLWLSGLLLIAGSAVVAVHQFQTRRFVRSVALAVPMVAVVLVAARFWPWDCAILFTQINDPEPAPFAAAGTYPGLQLTMGPAHVDGKVPSNARDNTRTWIKQTMVMQGLPDGLAIGNVTLTQSWLWPDDPAPVEGTFNFSDWSDLTLRKALAMSASQGDSETARWLEAQDADRRTRGLLTSPGSHYWKPQRQEERIILSGSTLVQDSIVTRLRAQRPAGEARVELELVRWQKLFELPLKPGITWSGQSGAFRLGQPSRDRQENFAEMQLLTARPGIRENGLWSADAMDRTRPRRPGVPELIVLNRSNNTIGSAYRSGEISKSGRVVVGGVVLQWSTLNVYTAKVIRNGKWVVQDPDWIEHSTLASVVPRQTVRLTRELKTEKFELEPSGPDNPPGETKPAKSF